MPATTPRQVAPEIARVLLSAFDSGIDAAHPSLPTPERLCWDGLQLDLENPTWVTEPDGLSLEILTDLHGHDLWSRWGTLNAGGTCLLRGGDCFESELVHLARWGMNIGATNRSTNCRFDFHAWTWSGEERPAAWVGAISGLRVDSGNLRVRELGWPGFALGGAYDLYVLKRTNGEHILVVDTGGRELVQALLRQDLLALEFATGSTVSVPWLRGLNPAGTTVAAIDPSFVSFRGRAQPHSPVPDFRGLIGNQVPRTDVEWLPVLFEQLSAKLRNDGDDSPLNMAIGAYLDSITGHIHGQYLFLQVALEAFAQRVAPLPEHHEPLVRDVNAWDEFVARLDAEVARMALDSKAAGRIRDKLKAAATSRPRTSGRVAHALERFGLKVPAEALAEVSRRNQVAHEFSMGEESATHWETYARRVRMVRTLLVALIAKYIGYSGPIVGWDLRDGTWEIPTWWHWDRNGEASDHYVARARNGEER